MEQKDFKGDLMKLLVQYGLLPEKAGTLTLETCFTPEMKIGSVKVTTQHLIAR